MAGPLSQESAPGAVSLRRVTGSADRSDLASIADLMAFIAAAPSPFHAVAEASGRLEAAGFTRLDPTASWSDAPDRSFVARGGSLIAWAAPADRPPETPFHLVGAHTDSPNLRIKPRPDTGRAGWRQLGVEVYGGALVNSWLDRDLGLVGSSDVRGRLTAPRSGWSCVDRPLLRVPQLAIHLDREINANGLLLNPQQHLARSGASAPAVEGEFARVRWPQELDVAAEDVLAWDVMTPRPHATCASSASTASCLASRSARQPLLLLDARSTALIDAADRRRRRHPGDLPVRPRGGRQHVGHRRRRSRCCESVLERVGLDARRHAVRTCIARWPGRCASRPTWPTPSHPNYAERHEPGHHVAVNAGPVLKINANQRYATDAESAALLRRRL